MHLITFISPRSRIQRLDITSFFNIGGKFCKGCILFNEKNRVIFSTLISFHCRRSTFFCFKKIQHGVFSNFEFTNTPKILQVKIKNNNNNNEVSFYSIFFKIFNRIVFVVLIIPGSEKKLRFCNYSSTARSVTKFPGFYLKREFIVPMYIFPEILPLGGKLLFQICKY